MKNLRIIIPALLAFAFLISSCTYHIHNHKRIPPGHAKKITGSKSAKHHAPGHNKHHKHYKRR